MSKEEKKAMGVVSGILAIIAALTDATSKKSLKETHMFAILCGGALTIISATA